MRGLVSQVIQSLHIFTALDVAEILYSLYPDHYSNLHSARIQAQKELNTLVALGKLERGKGFYRLPGCKSKYGDHARLVTRHIADLIKLNLPLKTFREHTTPIGLRPDVLCLLQKNNQAICFVLECVRTEPLEYLQQKYNALMAWDGACEYLSNLFAHPIPQFSFVVAGNTVLPDVITFDDLMKEVKREG